MIVLSYNSTLITNLYAVANKLYAPRCLLLLKNKRQPTSRDCLLFLS